ncbi:MAG: hypothetical protein EB078_02575 [Proteobacteria bacterium]|nr:hypothetical protein [Pseudomonadota bacterium]NDC23355.1 hypothetical protein [Pseudomonadota bacterium]NDD03767.1 hypothetical protein [Pseudomonadota bacterium]NDG26147.1 hypothetical protein [Pseudomonadota bacterium]
MKWAQQGSPSSHWTIAVSDQWYLVGLVSIFIAHLFLAMALPPSEDELYYWTWSQTLSLSYFDHPPLVAWLISLSTRVFGHSILGIRCPAILTHFFVLYQLGKLSPNKTILGLLLLTPLSLFGSVIMTPDIPLIFFWLCYLQWALATETRFSTWGDDPLTRVYRQSPVGYRAWFIGGLFLGLGLLSKYTMALAPICLFFLLASRYRLKAWVKGFAIHLFIAFVLFSPVLVFNRTFNFEPIKFQWEHTQNAVSWTFVFTFLGGQILILGALPFLMFPWLLLHFKNYSRLPKLRTLAYFFLLPFVFFLYKSTHHFVDTNWALVTYISFWPLADHVIAQTSFRPLANLFVFVSFLIPLTLTGAIFIHLSTPIRWIPVHQDRLSRMKSQLELAKQISSSLYEMPQLPVYLQSYQWTSYFRFLGITRAQQLANASRKSQFTLIATADPCSQPALLFLKGADDPVPSNLNCFKKQKLIEQFRLEVRGQELEKWSLMEFTKPENPK